MADRLNDCRLTTLDGFVDGPLEPVAAHSFVAVQSRKFGELPHRDVGATSAQVFQVFLT